MEEIRTDEVELKDQVVQIRRVTKVVKGGKNFSFSALVVVGDGAGKVGFGLGKAREVPLAISKGMEQAKRSMVSFPLSGTTIPHYVEGHYGAGHVILRPASKGTGVIAGGAVRALMEVGGIQDVLTFPRHLPQLVQTPCLPVVVGTGTYTAQLGDMSTTTQRFPDVLRQGANVRAF